MAEEAIRKAVEDCWQEYDSARDGALDKQGTKRFVKAILNEMEQGGGNEMDDVDFEQFFAQNKDGSGRVNKSGVVRII